MANGVPDSLKDLGVLSKTIVKSPVAKAVHGARLHNGRHKDVVFVNERCIHVKQLTQDAQLEPLVYKDDFDDDIRSSGIFTVNSQPTMPTSSSSDNGQPQDLLVLVLGNSNLAFLCLREEVEGTYSFAHETRSIPVLDEQLYQPGTHIAIDHSSRAIAVAANEREVIMYSCKSQEDIERALRAGHDWCPISSEKMAPVEGVIQHIDFLIPPEDNQDLVVLALIVVIKRRTKVVWIEWLHSQGLNDIFINSAQPLDCPKTAPNLFVPLHGANFMLAHGTELLICTGLLSGSVTSSVVDAPLGEGDNHDGNSPRAPIWVSWQRPWRSNRQKDTVILIAEDGLVAYFEIGGSSVEINSPGYLGCYVDGPFASLSDENADILAVAGSMSYGILAVVDQEGENGRQAPDWSYGGPVALDSLESIPNWASVTDIVSVPFRIAAGISSRLLKTHPCVLVTSGRQPYGSVTELRVGVEASETTSFELDDLRTTLGMWAVPSTEEDAVLVFVTNKDSTRILEITVLPEIEVAELDAEDAAFDFEYRTLVAAAANGRIFQVTSKAVIATDPMSQTRKEVDDEVEIMCADILPAASIIITVELRGSRSVLCCTHCSGGQMAESIRQLHDEATAVAVGLCGSTILSVATFYDGTVILFLLEGENIEEMDRLNASDHQDLNGVGDGVYLLPSAVDEGFTAVIGLRDGRIHHTTVECTGARPRFGNSKSLMYGTSTVKLIKMHDARSLIIISGLDIGLLTVKNGAVTISSIWQTKIPRPELSQDCIVAAAQMPELNVKTFSRAAMLVCGDRCSIAQLSSSPDTVPRRIPVSGTPNRVLFSKQQRCLVVSSKKFGIREGSNPLKRQVWPVIDFIPARYCVPTFTFELQPRDTVFSLLEWTYQPPSDSVEKKWSFILAGGSHQPSNGTAVGKIWFLQPVNHEWKIESVSCTNTVTKFPSGPVYSLAKYDDLSYIACAGRQVHVMRFDSEAKKWFACCEPFTISSPGVHVTVDDAKRIYVSTARDSLRTLILKALPSDHPGEHTKKLVGQFSGPRAEELLCHLYLEPTTRNDTRARLQPHPEQTYSKHLLLTADRDDTLTGLDPIAVPSREREALRVLFRAKLPSPLTRLCDAEIRPAWKAEYIPGVVTDRAVGCTTDGALVGVVVLTKALFEILGRVMKEGNPARGIEEDWQQFARRDDEDEIRHINGDGLARVVERGKLRRILLDMDEDAMTEFGGREGVEDIVRRILDWM
ncbi:hypothetical protein K470DRAFT_258498 [Piedraia hortae CBS 480.64]|uniref:RSE1/DDB1/CPSF1 first beta-propeller domain-containing protein n=1 Tax=Piedraia hortae CBS 480.64 TaxID=1314780 RepID=A0A6A7BWS6_9PEZI|nr:hypothetical protein K470DRAFT_258498 [Piedraia hortae CBS 480.64]